MPDVLLPSCFGDHHGSSEASSSGSLSRSSAAQQNMVTCLYRTTIDGDYKVLSVTWFKTLMGQGLLVQVDDPSCQLACHIDMKPWLFWKKQGSKSFETRCGSKLEVVWDLTSAKYGSGPEPKEGFFVCVICGRNVVLLLGDMQKEAMKKVRSRGRGEEKDEANHYEGAIEAKHERKEDQEEEEVCKAVLLSRREHMSGRRIYTTRARFFETGGTHDIAIECHTGCETDPPRLSVRIDKKLVVQVKRLMWKFRGNQTILIDGLPIEVFWDVHNWLFNPSNGNEHAIFMFQACKSNDKPWMREVGVSTTTTTTTTTANTSASIGSNNNGNNNGNKTNDKIRLRGNHKARGLYQESMCTSALHWPKSHSFKSNKDPLQAPVGFSLLLFAWRNE